MNFVTHQRAVKIGFSTRLQKYVDAAHVTDLICDDQQLVLEKNELATLTRI